MRQQAFPEWQWVVVDGGSTDGTLEAVSALADQRCVWISEKDRGIYDAMNKGLRLASSEYLIFMNAGDEFAGPEVLHKVADAVRKSGKTPDFVFGDACERTAGGRMLVKAARPANTVTYGMFTHHQSMIYRRESIAGLEFNPEFMIAGDYDFTCRLLRSGARDLQVPFPICIFRRGGLSGKRAAIGRREVLQVQRSVLKLSGRRRLLNRAGFVFSQFLQNYLRGPYDRIRFR